LKAFFKHTLPLLLIVFCCKISLSVNLDSLINLTNTSNNIEHKIDAFNKLGWELRFSDNAKSREYLESSFKLLASHNYPKGRAQALNNYGCNIMLMSQFKEAEDSLTKAVALYKSLNLNEEAGKAITNIGTIYYYRGQINEAIEHCEKAMEYFEMFPEKAAMTNVNMGVMFRTIGNYDLAIKKQLLALDYFKSVKDTSKQITSLNNIGSLYIHFLQYDKALDYFNESIELSNSEPEGKASAYAGRGAGYLKLKMYDNALSNLNLALNIYDSLGLKKEYANAKYNVGSILFTKKEYDKALETVLNAKSYFIKLGLEREKIVAINMIGLIYFEKNQNDSAMVYLQQALDLQQGIDDPIIYQSTLRSLAKVYELKGDHIKANELHNLYNNSKDSIFSVIASEKVAETEAKFRLKEKEKQLSEAKEVNQSLSEKIKGFGVWLVVLLCLVLLFAFIYFRKRKEATFIKSQKEDILKKYSSLEDAYANMYNALEKFQQNNTSANNEKPLPEWVSQLSKRELEVLSCLAVGMTDQEISEKLFVSLATVRTHCRRIYSKLLVKNRSEAANVAREYGLI
jgi:tetratricopeptide (TPR) repeat protein